MMHPKTRVRTINETIGLGVVAAEFIPKGTVVYVRDAIDICLPPDDPLIDNPVYRDMIERYSYIEPDGSRIICWDGGKYVNHACDPSTLSTGYGFEIAIRDIAPGEELTDDYGLLNCLEKMELTCGEPDCRKVLDPADFDRLVPSWDARIKEALRLFREVDQPLLPLIPQELLRAVDGWLRTGRGYWSTRRCKLGAGDAKRRDGQASRDVSSRRTSAGPARSGSLTARFR